MVGTRTPSPYGRAVAERIAADLTGRGITVVSGLARGIGTAAHAASLRAGGRRIAVIGSGLDVIYRPENSPLADRIARQGVLVTEFEMGTKPEPSNFPRRNRIVSGMSLGTVVVETAPNGGATITSAMALEQNREVFALPSPIGGARPSGTNRLIREGKALLVESADDILAELGPRLIDIKDGPPTPPWPEPGRRSSSGGCSISWVMPRSMST